MSIAYKNSGATERSLGGRLSMFLVCPCGAGLRSSLSDWIFYFLILGYGLLVQLMVKVPMLSYCYFVLFWKSGAVLYAFKHGMS